MEVLIQHRGDVKFEASTRDHRVTCDQPAGNGGSDSGMTPPEYLLVSLGTCAGFYAAQYLKVRSLGHQGLEVKVRNGPPGQLQIFRDGRKLFDSKEAGRLPPTPELLRLIMA